LSSDFGARRLRGIDCQRGLTARRAAAVRDPRHPSSIAHACRALFAQRSAPSASGYAAGHAAKRLRPDPLLPLRGERRPLAPAPDRARAPPLSRLEHRLDRKALERLTRACVDPVLARAPAPPAALVLDREHSADPTPGQQAVAFSNHPARSEGSLPLGICAGPAHALGPACWRPGTQPPGAEKARIGGRLLGSLRRHWPPTPRRVRRASHFAPPEVLEGLAPRRPLDGVVELAGNAGLLRQAAPVMPAARRRGQQRPAGVRAQGEPPPPPAASLRPALMPLPREPSQGA
jgi:hypothetical protein